MTEAAPAVAGEERLRALVQRSPIMLFMKGSPDAPQCGFSAKVVAALRAVGAEFDSFDILGDAGVRQGLKAYSNWPTFPQLYVAGELLGGCDIVLELAASGELAAELAAAGAPGDADRAAQLKALVSSSPVMLFMKGEQRGRWVVRGAWEGRTPCPHGHAPGPKLPLNQVPRPRRG